MALPAVPALYAGPPPRPAHLRGLPGALLPQGRLQRERPVSRLHIQHALPGDGAHALRAGVCSTEQRLLVPTPAWHSHTFFLNRLTRLTDARTDSASMARSQNQRGDSFIHSKNLLFVFIFYFNPGTLESDSDPSSCDEHLITDVTVTCLYYFYHHFLHLLHQKRSKICSASSLARCGV